MAGLEIIPFSEEHLDAAAVLLEARHARHREAEPLLPAEVDFRAQLESEWHADGASGVFATRADEPVGYLVAAPRELGPMTWMTVGIGGHAVEGDRELAQDLYATAAAAWVDAGHLSHAVFIPSADAALVDTWFRLSFGASAVLAMRETVGEPPFEADVEVRLGTADDLAVAARLDKTMRDAMVPSPSFSGFSGFATLEEYVDEWRDTWDDDRFVHFVAERDGDVLGQAVLYRRPHDLRVPKDSIDLANAASFPERRGSGIGRALTAHVLRWADEHDYATMTTDWRLTNLLAARFWPKRGFRTAFLRLYRALP